MASHCCDVLYISIVIFIISLFTESYSQSDYDFTDTPKIVTQDGHLVFMSAERHNITFRSSSTGNINLNGEDLMAIVRMVKDNRNDVDDLRSGQGNGALLERLAQVEQQLQNLQATGEVQARLNELSNQITNLTQRIEQTTLGPTALNPIRQQIRTVNSRVSELNRQTREMNRMIRRNECNSSPCQHGGTCMDRFSGYTCTCTQQWQGRNCEEDVNECATLAGTDLGCQNGATCTNTPGSFTCTCPSDRHGVLCTETHDDCTGASSRALCDHGTCINVQRVQPGQPKYECICEGGWTTNGQDPACSVDVDECEDLSRGYPCSVNPHVQCVNLPGTFRCMPCPAGYTGDGRRCIDVDECETNNGGCSLAPRVQCTNTIGSRVCGACPPGYQGDGVTCTSVGICATPNHGCYPLATCVPAPNSLLGRMCLCPPGYMGVGVGPNGCVASQGQSCASNPCANGGTCIQRVGSILCQCALGWQGSTCSVAVNACASNPCMNGGTCTSQGTGYACECTNSWSGERCEEQQNSCGGVLVQESGSLRYPSDSSRPYPHGVSCAWVINTAPNKILTLNFASFKLEQHASCDYDFLAVHDGPTASSQLIGKFCGDLAQLPNGGVINTTHHQVYLWFKSDASNNADGFNIHWTSAIPECGGLLEDAQHGVIRSPGFPGNYPHNRECEWRVKVSPGHIIRFQFTQLQLENHPNCSYDYLTVYDGLQDGSAQLRRFCGTPSQLPQPFMTTGPYARLHLHTDGSMSDKGFSLAYSEETGPNACGGSYNQDSGFLISPNYPNNYPHGAQCIWTITVPEGQRITLNFTNMDIESHDNCRYDYVELRNGNDEDSPFIGKFCGRTVPLTRIQTPGNQLWVKFNSDMSSSGSGFRFAWLVECGGTFTAPSGELTSPYFPERYPNNKECIYRISQPEGSAITLNFTTFDIEASRDNCAHDFLEVRDGSGPNSSLLGRYCGSSIPPNLVSRGNELWLKFKSDSSIQLHGFKATYIVNYDAGTEGGSEAEGGSETGGQSNITDSGNTTLTSCGGSLITGSGTFTSPGHPNSYPHGVNCTWYIGVAPGQVIRLTFDSFIMESDESCAYDNVVVVDGTSGSRFGPYCGSNVPPVITSSDNTLTVIFRTDSSVARDGFSASYVTIDEANVCGGYLNANTGLISSPNYPQLYPHNRDCEWMIVVENGHQILLNITDLAMESHASCEYDYLEIRNGGTDESPLIGKFCGRNNESREMISHSNRVFLKFHSDGSSSDRGFQLFYSGASEGCGGELTAPSGSIISPNYPLPYSHAATCFWTITVSQGNQIILTLVDIEMEGHETCNYDYLLVRDDSSSGTVLGKFCGTTVPEPVTSRNNVLWLKFRSDYSAHGRGFRLNYVTSCNVRLNTLTGVIESPNFPGPYPHSRDCEYTIETTRGNTIAAQFTAFNIEAGSDCPNDYVEVREGGDSGRYIGKYCHEDLPPPIVTDSNTLTIKFVTDSSVSYSGFRLEYASQGCGRHMSGTQGNFTSPNYPTSFPHGRDCIWTIEVPGGMRVELSILDLDIGDCSQDKLKVYGGIDTTSQLLTAAPGLCNTISSTQILTSTGSYMTVLFSSNSTSSGRGFNAAYRAVTGGCGGNFSAASAHITSPDYPNSYPHSWDCLWHISVQADHTVRVVFTDLQMESHETCSYDYVAMYDGDSTQDPLMARVCRATSEVYTTSGNQMTVRMRTDSSVAGRGFNFTYYTSCGGRRDSATDGAIASPNFSESPYTNNLDCVWYIYSSHPDDRITLTFTDLAIQRGDGLNCSKDYVQVRDGDDSDAPVVGTYCGSTLPSNIVSQGSGLVVIFHTNNETTDTGFRAVYTKSTAGCGGLLTEESGSFSSPRYPNPYPNNVECIWEIRGVEGTTTQLVFSTFDLESNEDQLDCSNAGDYVEIREANATHNLLGRYCGRTISLNTTRVPSLWLKFVSNGAVAGTGFTAMYNIEYGGPLVGAEGVLTSPRYPLNYPDNVHYTWVITVPTNLRAAVRFTDFQLEFQSGCTYDYVQIRDGGTNTARSLAKLCGSNMPALPYVATSNEMQVVFHADSSSTYRGFRLMWSAVISSTPVIVPDGSGASGCGGNIQAMSNVTTLTSPNYPREYMSGSLCLWRISAPPSYQVWFNFTDLSTESHSTCNFDYVALYSGAEASPSKLLGKFCGSYAQEAPILSNANTMLVKFRTDSSLNRRGFSANYKYVCGGMLNTTQGSLMAPGSADTANCTWFIRVTPGRTVQLNFNHFSLAGAQGQCSNTYITVYNGEDTNSPILGEGRYCGNNAPAPLESSYHMVTVRFYRAASEPISTFRINYEEKPVECGGSIQIDSSNSNGFITSPNFPEAYPVNTECIWTLTVEGNQQVQLDFPEPILMERHNNCSYDFVEIRDGGNENAELLGRFCDETPDTLKSSGNALYVRMRSDASAGGTGFKIAYKIAECGGTYSGNEGIIESPNYPNNYDNNLDCEWFIRAPTGHFLTLTFLNFNTEGATNCLQGDYVQINDYNQTGTQLALQCGTSATAVNTSDSYAFVKFHSNGAGQNSGFRMQFTASIEECGGMLTTPIGRLTSPNYPGQYPHSRNCVWRIQAPQGRRVTLTINDLNMEAHDRCAYDYLAVFNGALPDSPMIGSRLCGQIGEDRVIESTGRSLTVQFRTDGSVSNGGFAASYTTNNAQICGGVLTTSTGTIESPGYSGRGYNSSMQCIWILDRAQHGGASSVAFKFDNFNLERHGNCLYDHVEIREGADETGHLIARLCGNDTIPRYVSPSPVLWIRFVSDTEINDQGFQLSYKYESCGGYRSSRSGSVQSPNYPRNYNHNDDCAWVIRAPEGTRIRIHFADIKIESHPGCQYDYVELFNGGAASSPSIGRFCGESGREDFISQSNRVRIEWHSDDSSAQRGFKIDYNFISQGCGGLFHDLQGEISSPNWPQNYEPSSECVWELVLPDGYHIEAAFVSPFSFQTDCNDYLQIEDFYEDAWQVTGRFCGVVAPEPLRSRQNKMRIKFHADQAQNFPGFKLNYTAGCGSTYSASSGTLVSPGFPNGYTNNLHCNYTITVDPTQFIRLEFTDMYVEGKGPKKKEILSAPGAIGNTSVDTILKLIPLVPAMGPAMEPFTWSYFFPNSAYSNEGETVCMYDSVRVFAGPNAEGFSLGQYCGTTPPQVLSSRGAMHLEFITDSSVTDRGWRANYYMQECGGFYNGSTGVIHTPTHPNNYHHNANCSWTITVEPNRIVSLKFTEFSLEGSSACEYDYVSVYDGANTSARLIGRFCGTVAPPILRSTGNQLYIVFGSDSSVSLRGFQAAYYTSFGEHQGCGGVLNTTSSGEIKPVDIDNDGWYEPYQDCTWLVQAPENKVIQLRTTGSFSVEVSNCLVNDYLEIRDGRFESDRLVGRYCGPEGPPEFTSSTNSLYIRFVSDGSVQGTGFTLEYATADKTCGGILTATETPQTLTSQNYPSPYPANVNCRWVVDAPPADYSQKVLVRVSSLDIEFHGDCTYDFLELRDQPMGTAGQSLMYCGNRTVPQFQSAGSTMQINMKTDASSHGSGFSLTYAIASCNHTYTMDNGRLTSPGWPSLYHSRQNCYMVVNVEEGRTLALYFNVMTIEENAECTYDYLEILNGTDGAELARLCGSTLPDPIFISGNTATLHFVTDPSVTYSGFDITYASTTAGLGCGGTFTYQNGTFTSPGYPALPQVAQECRYEIRVAARLRITLSWDFLSFSSASESCETTNLSVFNGNPNSDTLLMRYCGDEDSQPAPYVSSTNHMTLVFKTDNQISGSGFKLGYTS